MRFVPNRSSRCADARARISLLADDELSEFERRLLVRHLRGCGECGAFMIDVDAGVNALRGAPLVPLETEIVLPQRERPRLRRMRVLVPATAALVLVVTGAIGGIDSLRGNQLEPLGVVGGMPSAVNHGSRIIQGFTVSGRLITQ
jgi:anti-sigma factor RsiW